MFERMKKAVTAESMRTRKERAFYIRNGYMRTWAKDYHNDKDRGLRDYLTPAKWEKYSAGQLTRKEAVTLAVARMEKQEEKELAGWIAKLDKAASAPILEYAEISVEWTRSRTWGNCPRVKVWTNNGDYSGYASGCGYDKESTAIADALNGAPEFLKALYTAKEKRPSLEGSKALGYGAGYSLIPYLEGGVGVSCFRRIFETIGYTWECTASGKTYDHYRITRRGKK